MNRPVCLPLRFGPTTCDFREWRIEDGRVFHGFYAFDTETTAICRDNPTIVPSYVLGAVCDGKKGYFLSRDRVPAFFQVHADLAFVCHNAAFDLKVTQQLLADSFDLYSLVERKAVWDTWLLHRLYTLATQGHTARGKSSLQDCLEAHLGIPIAKAGLDADGNVMRTSFDQFLNKDLQEIPESYLRYLATDAVATYFLFVELHKKIKKLLQTTGHVWGFGGEEWFKEVKSRFGPLTHHIQLKASILMDYLSSTGIVIDESRRDEKVSELKNLEKEYREQLHMEGYLPGSNGCQKALQSILQQRSALKKVFNLPRTPTGKISTSEQDLAEFDQADPFIQALIGHRQAVKLLSTFLSKMNRKRVFGRFHCLLETGRTSCGGDFPLQTLPREGQQSEAAKTLRGALKPEENYVFIDADYGQIELVTLAAVLKNQFQFGDSLARIINQGEDVHRLLAAAVLNKKPEDVTKQERTAVKAISFGRPGGMGARRLQTIAKNNYGVELDEAQILERIAAYHKLCPELDAFLEDDRDVGLAVAQLVQITPADYMSDCHRWYDPNDQENYRPAAWLGNMFLRVLGEANPCTRTSNRSYSSDEIEFFWDKAQVLHEHLPAKYLSDLVGRRPGEDLKNAVRDLASRRPVFTFTGRLRADATFCASRNTTFQGLAADGAVLGLWKIWRKGYEIRNFIHDQVIVSVPVSEDLVVQRREIEDLMKAGMAEVIPGMKVKVESSISRSMHKDELYVPG